MLFDQRSRRRAYVLCAGCLVLSTTQAYAQLGQSDWIRPGTSDASPASTAPANMGTPTVPTNDINPGKGWMPNKRGLPARMQTEAPVMAPVAQPGMMAPVPQQGMMAPVEQQGMMAPIDQQYDPSQQQQMMQPQQADQMSGGPPLQDDGSMPWQDAPRRRKQTQQVAPPAEAAFHAPPSGTQDPWSLPSAQQQMDLQWAQNLPNVPMSAVTPTAPAKPTAAKPAAAKPGAAKATTAAKPTGKPGTISAKQFQKPPASQLSGVVQENANALQPTSEFDPNAGYQQMGGGMQSQQGPYGMSAQQPMQQMQQPMQQMQQPMDGGMQQMSGMQQQPMAGGMQQMGGMQQQPMAGGMSAMGGGMPAMGGMNPMQLLGGGDGANPLDAIGKAIAGAAAMGLIPSAGAQGQANVNAGFDPSRGPYAQMQGGMQGGMNMQPGMRPVQQQPQQRPQQQQRRPQQQNQMVHQMGNTVTKNVNRTVNQMMHMGMSRLHW